MRFQAKCKTAHFSCKTAQIFNIDIFFAIVGHSFVNCAQFSRIPTVQYHEPPCFFGIKPQKVAKNRLTGDGKNQMYE